MNSAKALELEAWEDEGGATLGARAVTLTGTANQVEWAGRIKRQVNDEFDRVARSFLAVAAKQSDPARADTGAIVAILEEKRAEVMLKEHAGYFIQTWQEMGGQVRRMISDDARYQAIRSKRLQAKFSSDQSRQANPMATERCSDQSVEGPFDQVKSAPSREGKSII